jgi:hypothetical protein
MGQVLAFPASNSTYPDIFIAFWEAYPKRMGSNPKWPAYLAWKKALKLESAESIVRAAKNFSTAMGDKVGTQFIPMGATWLNQRRWEEYLTEPAPEIVRDLAWWTTIMAFYRRTGIWPKYAGIEPGQHGCAVPQELLSE